MKSIKIFITSFLLIGLTGFATVNPKEESKTIKVALLLDTSNSMDGLINQAKAQLWEIVNELSYAKYNNKKPNLQIALYEYGNDGLSSRSGYIRRVLRFSNDLDEISEKLFSLRTNGGSEYCGAVIQQSLNDLEWGKNKGDLKLIFIAGNESFTQGRVNYRDAITNAKEQNIIINTIFCGDYNSGISGMWQDGAYKGGGDYMTINQNKNIVHVATPYDAQIVILNRELNKTYIYYGKNGLSKFRNQSKQDSNATTLNEAVAVKRAVSKSSSFYKNSTWDLVDAEKNSDFNYDKLKQNELPKELQGKSKAAIKKYVSQKSKERKEIQGKIRELNKKRTTYIAKKQRVKKNDELESVLINAIKKQAKKKNYNW